jgi:hypothetical protein
MKGESLWEFIQRFCNKRNIIPEVDDKSIIMFFKKGLMDSSLIRKLTMENLRMSKEMFNIAIKYALAKEATFNTREQKEKESGHTDQPGSSKGHDKKRKADRSVNAVEQLQHHKEYRPRLGDFEGFASASSNPRNSTRSRTVTDSKVLQMRFSRRPEVPITSPKPNDNFPEAHKGVNYIYGGPDLYESRRKQKLTDWEVMVVSPATPEYLR